jgi:LacI family transcriptional regulator
LNNTKDTITIKDIAKSLSLSSATVSNALNNKGRMSIATKEAVIQKAKEIGYEQNMIGKALIEGKTDIIGVFVPEISNEYYSLVVSGIEKVLDENKYSIILIKTGYQAKKEYEAALKLKRLFIRGLIFLGGRGNHRLDIVESFKDISTLFIDRKPENDNIASVVTNNYQSMQNAVIYLNNLGHKKIGYFANYPGGSSMLIKERFEGFVDAAKNLHLESDFVFNQKDLDIEPDQMYQFIKSTINNIDKQGMPTAFLCQNDIYAIILIKVLHETGLKVPEDVSVMGFDNVSISKYIVPSLTTVKQPKRQMGVIGAKLLLQIINEEEIAQKNIVLVNEIIERDSVRKI